MDRNITIERISKKLVMISEEKDIRIKYFVIGIVLIPIILTIMGTIMYSSSLNGKGSKSADANVVVTPSDINEIAGSTGNAKGLSQGSFETSMTTEWHFSYSDAMSGDAYVQNVLENTNDIYFDVVLADDPDHVIYRSPIIPRGSYLENIVLDEALEAGTYDCVLIYYLIDDENNPVSTLDIDISIVVAEQSVD